MTLRSFSSPLVLFILMWTVWFALPRTRGAALAQWKQQLQDTPLTTPTSARDSEFVNALNPWPADQESNTRGAGSSSPSTFEALEQKFPDDASIYANHILALSSRRDHLIYRMMRRTPSSSSLAPVSFPANSPSAQILRSWFATVKRGAACEPDNTFWDWAQIIGLYAAQRDNEVWPVLRAASHKTRYDDHSNAGLLARLRLAKEKGLLSLPKQLTIYSERFSPLSFDFSVLDEATDNLCRQARNLYKLGQPLQRKQALEGMRDLLLLGSMMRLEAKSAMASSFGQEIEAIAFYGLSSTYPGRGFRNKPKLGVSLSQFASTPGSLLFDARQMKRSDIAAQVAREWNAMNKWRSAVRSAVVTSPLFGVDQEAMWPALIGDWLGRLLVAGIPSLLVLALVCSLLLRVVPSWKSRAPVALGTWSWLGAASLTVLSVLTLCTPILGSLWIAWRMMGMTPLGIFIPPTFFPQDLRVVPSVWITYFSVALIVPLSLWSAVVWNARRNNKPSLASRLRAMASPSDDLTRFDLSPLLSLIAIIALCSILVGGVVGFLLLPTFNYSTWGIHQSAGLFLFVFALVPSIIAFWKLCDSRDFALAFVIARRLAWGQLLCASLLWGVLWMAVAPAHERFDASFARKASLGEVQLARQQAGL